MKEFWNLRIIDRMEVSDFAAFLLVLNILVLLALAAEPPADAAASHNRGGGAQGGQGTRIVKK